MIEEPSHGPTAYERRKAHIDLKAAKAIFDPAFALKAFTQGMSAGKGGRRAERLPNIVVTRIDADGHSSLAHSCLAYLLAHENAPERTSSLAYLACLRQIRDGARQIAEAADVLANQAHRHRHETGGDEEVIRSRTLFRLACALHGNFLDVVEEQEFAEKLSPRLMGAGLSDNRMTHGLVGCVALFNEAEAIRKQHLRNQALLSGQGHEKSGMRSGNEADDERQAFVLDLAALYESALGTRPVVAHTQKGDQSPFRRFINCVFAQLLEQSELPIDREYYLPPSEGTLKNILKMREVNSS